MKPQHESDARRSFATLISADKPCYHEIMLRCANELAEFLLSRRSSYANHLQRLRARRDGHARLDDVAADQLVGGLLASAADMLCSESGETLGFYLEVGLDGLGGAGEELPAFVGSMAAFFVGLTDDVVRGFPMEHQDEVIPWIEAFCGECVGGSVRTWRQDWMA